MPRPLTSPTRAFSVGLSPISEPIVAPRGWVTLSEEKERT